jgi:hypothetical protein
LALEVQMAAQDTFVQEEYNLELEDPARIHFSLQNEVKNQLYNFE